MLDSLRSQFLVALFVLPAAQEPTKPAADAVPTSLFPPEMLVYAQSRSLEALEAWGRGVWGAVGEEFSLEATLAGASGVHCDLSALDRARPIAFGLCFFDVAAGAESIGFLPVGDEARFLETYVRPPMAAEPVLRDGYAALPSFELFTPGGDPPRAGAGLLPGDIAVRVDLEALVEAYRPTIEMMLEGMRGAFADPGLRAAVHSSGGMDPQAMLDSYADAVESAVDSAELFDLALALEGELLRVDGAYTALEGSALADWGAPPRPAEMADLASLMDPGAQFSLLASIDIDRAMARIRPWLDGLMQAYPEPMRASMRRLMEVSAELAPVYGREMALSGQLSEGGVRSRAYWRPSDPAKVVASYGQFLDPVLLRGMGVELTGPNPLEIDGIAVTQWQWSYDVEQIARATTGGDPQSEEVLASAGRMLVSMFGTGPLTISVAAVGAYAVVVFGGDEAYLREALARARLPASARSRQPPAFERAIASASRVNPSVVLSLDLGSYLAAIRNLMESMDPAAATDAGAKWSGERQPLFLWGGIEGRVWRGGGLIELATLGKFRRSFEEAMEEARSGR